jgi:hypothetical protein
MFSCQKKLQEVFKTFTKGNYNLLLIFLVFIFIFRPYAPGLLYLGIWKIFLTATLLAAIFNCEHRTLVKKTVLYMAIPSLALTWIDLFFTQEIIFLCYSFFTILFIIVCAASILYDVLMRTRVSLETLKGVVCAYFLVAFMFSYIYFLIEYVNPGSMLINGKIIPVIPHPYYLAQMLYFSFITLLTIGYGDIIAVKDAAQTACVLEGLIGQFYIAILVSRLVAIHSFKQVSGTHEKHHPSKNLLE